MSAAVEQFCPVVIGTHWHDAGDIPLVVIGNRLRYEACVIAALVFAALALVTFLFGETPCGCST